MSQPDEVLMRDACLASDAKFEEPLARVHHAPGMLMGIEATRSEQSYHRRRNTRHAYWMHGSGTVVGLRLFLQGDDVGNDTAPSNVRLIISPGIAVDGLGREVTVHEPFFLDLGAWLKYRFEDGERRNKLLSDGLSGDLLWLKVTLRYQDRPSGLQPVMATEINAGTDPVQPSRIQDGALFEMMAERLENSTDRGFPFPSHAASGPFASLEGSLSPRDKARIAQASEPEKKQLQWGTRLLHALGDDNHALSTSGFGVVDPSTLARTLLARISVKLGPGQSLIVNKRRMEVDNLVRPFLFNPDVLARLHRA